MDTGDGKRIITEVNEFITLAEKGAEADAESSAANVSLLSESLDDFGTELLSFEETTALLLNQVENLFSICQRYDRSTSEYLSSCKHLGKGIRYLAGACLTKAALKQKGIDLPQLETLTTDKLGRMVSFTIRKCNRTIDDTMRDKKVFPLDVFGMQLQYTILMDRLRATESNISRIKWCLADPWKYAKGAQNLKERKDPGSTPETPVTAFRRAPSFPMVRIAADEEKSPTADDNREQQTETGMSDTASPKLLPAPAAPAEEDHADTKDPERPDPAAAEVSENNSGEDIQEVTFTVEEMVGLLENPIFCREHPDMAGIFRQILREYAQTIEWTDDDS